MYSNASDVAFTSAVKSIQSEQGSRESYAKMERGSGWQTTVTPQLREFLSELDMFYLGTSNAAGQPYIQYRGGAPGFLKVLDDKTLGFADFGGNRQYISWGNLSENPQVFLFLMDYVNRRRIKVWATGRVVSDDAELLRKLQDEAYPGRAERAIVLDIQAWDVNCPQHIHRRFPQRMVTSVVDQLKGQISELEAKLADLTQQSD